MASFTTVNDTLELFVPAKGETIAVAISGTYDQTIDLQLELGSKGSGAWQTVKQFNTEDETEAFDYITKSVGENLRLLLRTDAGGTAVVTLTDTSDKLIRAFKDPVGNSLLDLRQSGATIPGDLTIDGLSSLEGNVLSAGVGIEGIALVYSTSILRIGKLIKTEIFIDLTGLNSQAQDLDIIGDNGTGEAWIAQLTEELHGTIYKAQMSCFELPATGDPNIALWEAVESTGVEDTLITILDETELLQSQNDGTDWAAGDSFALSAIPTMGEYLYLVQGDATGTTGTYTAGQFWLEFWGFAA